MLSFTPAAVAIFQILLSSFLSAFTFSRLYRRKNHLLVIISFTLFTLSIPIGLYNITIWKDIIFSQLIIFWGILAYFSIKDTRHDLSYSVLFLLSLLLLFQKSLHELTLGLSKPLMKAEKKYFPSTALKTIKQGET
jgi:hypothetical protein